MPFTNYYSRFLGLLFILPALFFLSCQNAVPPPQPNIILFLVDDMGWTDLGCYGNTFHETPNIDRMASEGMRFTNAYAACAVCSPSRAAIMTGKYPARLKITDWIPGHRGNDQFITPKQYYELPLEEYSLAEALHDAGYQTFHVGKWHLGETPPYWPEHQGFQVNIGGHSKGAPGSYYFPYAKLGPGNEWTTRNLPDGHENGDYLTDKLTDHALELIEDARGSSHPFFLYMAYYTVHTPQEGKPELVEKYRQKHASGDSAYDNFHYAAMVQSLDESVGRILKKLAELDIEEETFIVFTSDNGGLAGGRFNGNAPLRAGKGTHYEGGIREPFIVRWPGKVAAGTTSEAIVSGQDIYPTLLDIAGANLQHPVDGKNLWPEINEGRKEEERTVFWHYPHFHRGRPVSVIRRGDWKLIEFLETGNLELYHLKEDIAEENNLAATKPELAQELRQILDTWRKEVEAPPLLPKTTENESLARQDDPWGGSNNIKNPPKITEDESGIVTITSFNKGLIRYTLDGSDPDKDSPEYTAPFLLPEGGVINARTWSPNGMISDVETHIIPMSKDGWSVVSASSQHPEHNANLMIDVVSGTYWEAKDKESQEIILDMGKTHALTGFIYTPARREKNGTIARNSMPDNRRGAVRSYDLAVSMDGENWDVVQKGIFEHIKYAFLDPKTIFLGQTTNARYIRFRPLTTIDGTPANVEDISFFTVME